MRSATVRGEAIDRSGNAAGNGLAEHEPVGIEAVFARVAAGAGRHAMRLIDDEQRAGLAR